MLAIAAQEDNPTHTTSRSTTAQKSLLNPEESRMLFTTSRLPGSPLLVVGRTAASRPVPPPKASRRIWPTLLELFMKSISASIVVLAGAMVFAFGTFEDHSDTEVFTKLVGAVLSLIGLIGWVSCLKGEPY